ncbi:hypothetical protein B484DRAFT_176844 [Ochromonadaceae sp. CCMP2298]|nr:hypothetical protein B484DRAFT_176844 [Ochromonadaceae sp. CCMP2298]
MEFASNKPLQMLRELLKEQQIDAFIVGSGDAHLSEYVSSADLRRAFISNFDGSAGTALILQDRALLWTDGRYFLQAGKQLSSEWTLMKSGQPGVLEMAEWVAENLVRGQCVGVDSMLIPVGEARSLSNSFSKKGVELRAVDKNPVDTVWSTLGRPQVPPTPIRVMGLHLTGLSHPEKIGTVRDFIQKQGAQALLVTALDDVAWLFNFRGADVECNPVALSFAMVTVQTTYLFIDMAKVTDEAREHFGSSVILLPYTEVGPYVTEQAALGLVLMDFAQVNWGLSLCAGENSKSITNPIVLAKSIKNPTELEGFRQAHIRDGVALTAFFHWLEGAVKGGESVSEWQVTEILEKFRGKMKDHVGPSFGTIAAYGSNGAMMHYSPARETSAILGRESTYLQDSGAQYLDGTTDVTRYKYIYVCVRVYVYGRMGCIGDSVPAGWDH